MKPLYRLARCLTAVACLGSSSAAWAQDDWFRITGPDGATIGWQRETVTTAAGHTRFRRERQLAYKVDGHALVRQYLQREMTTDSTGRIIGHRLVMGRDARSGRPADPAGATDEVPLAAILAAATGGEKGAGQDDLHAIPQPDGTIMVERTHATRLDRAWRVRPSAAAGSPVVVQPMLGTAMTFSRSGPLGEADITPGASMPHPMIPAPYQITPAARRGHLRYRFGVPAGLSPMTIATADQRVSATADELTFDVCTGCGAPAGSAGDEPGAADLERWRHPSPWIESDAPELKRAAARAVRSGDAAEQVMARLGRLARQRLAGIDYGGHFSARSAWRRRQGDCTEDAVLLAALARAAGYPARVASGLVHDRDRYHGTRDAFLPHAWTLVWIDHGWRSFDISAGPFDATHIALAVGDGEPETITAGWRIAALLEWRAMAQVRSASPP